VALRLGVSSTEVQRTLSTNERALSDANRHLASGKRIDRTADDPAGSQIAETFTSQVKGYARAARNAYSGMNMARQTDVALAEVNNILIHIKGLAVQAATATLNDSDREILQGGAREMIHQIQAIAEQTDFAGTPVLDGTFIQKAIHIGMGYKEATSVTIKDARASYLGRYAVHHTDDVNEEALDRGDIHINEARIRATAHVDDQLSTTLQRTSAIAKVAAINDATDHSNVSAFVNETSILGETDIASGDLNAANVLEINGVVIGATEIQMDDASDVLVRAINQHTRKTGVLATTNHQSRLVLTAEDGRNIEVKTSGAAHEITGLFQAAGSHVQRASITLFSDDFFGISDRNALGGEAVIGVDANELIGANQDDVVETIDISTRRGANRAMLIVDRAMEALLQTRAQMGGMENRLEFTVNRLNEASKNAYHARSKIVDADIITETARLARGQILRQAFTTVLAQANNTPNQVLQLL